MLSASNQHYSEGTCTLTVSINTTCQCPSVPHQCHISVATSAHPVSPVSATYQCCQSVPPISARQCLLSVPVSAIYQCASVPPI
ncbi:unnamed protein product, partial [Staurois parvus]